MSDLLAPLADPPAALGLLVLVALALTMESALPVGLALPGTGIALRPPPSPGRSP